MKQNYSLEEVKSLVKKLREARGWKSEGRGTAISICLEAAELLEHFQWESECNKIINGKLKKAKKEEIESEVADIIVYLADFANCFNIDLSEALRRKMKKIDEKYPADQILKHGDKFYYAQKKKYRNGRG